MEILTGGRSIAKQKFFELEQKNIELQKEKQQLITWLEDKIRDLNYNIYKYDTWHEIGENKEFMKLQVGIYQEVLDFVNKGGKE